MDDSFENILSSELESLPINDYIKNELLNFYKKIKEIVVHNSSINLIIDNMNKHDSEMLISYATDIVEKMGLYTRFIGFKEYLRREYQSCVIIIDNMDEFEDEFYDNYRGEKKLTKFFTDAKMFNNMIIFNSCDKIENHLESINPFLFDIKQCIHIRGINSKKNLYEKLMERYKQESIECNITYLDFSRIYDELDKNKFVKNFDVIDYIYEYSLRSMILKNNDKIDASLFEDIINNQSMNDNQIELEDLVGLDNIRCQIDTLYNYLNFCKKKGIDNSIYLNLFFIGNPGTGKTTIARMYAKKLYDMQYIKEEKIIEVVPNDLIGEYVGHTRRKIREVLNKAEGGVLFIDEAYLLYSVSYNKGKNPYMEEAVIELIKYLEDPKHIVIFAGYPKEMKKIYEANPGLKSRIYAEINFDDYSSNELYQILEFDLKNKGLKLDNRGKSNIINYIEYIKQDKNFGNARSMKQLSQKMIMNHANRNNTKDIISYKDLPNIDNEIKFRMGFDIYDRRNVIK